MIWLVVVGGCTEPERRPGKDQPLEDIALAVLAPRTLIPGSLVALEGSGFLPEEAGPSTFTVASAAAEVALPAAFVDYQRMEVIWPGSAAAGGEGRLAAEARLSTDSAYDGEQHVSPWVGFSPQIAERLQPVLDALDDAGRQVNDRIEVQGDGMLLGGEEGQTVAVVEGCFQREGERACEPVGPVEIPVHPTDALDRSAGWFPFAPEIAGIELGTFEGTARLRNRHASGEESTSAPRPLTHEIAAPFLSGFLPDAASLGEIVTVEGGGFIGPGPGDPAAATLLELDGRFSAPGTEGFDVVLTLVGSFEEGARLRYVVNEEDALGRLVDVRSSRGTFRGTARPVAAFGRATVEGDAVPITLALEPVAQVVWLQFLPNFVESLRHFGLRNAEEAVVARIVEVTERDFAGVNLDIRLEEPTDFALYSVVELGGPDPNGLGLLGYDNTPGKDVRNLRLYDRIGGLSALTQQDGYPGYGGVFIDSLFVYSAHPLGDAEPSLAEPLFDALFDPLRAEAGGRRATADEVAALAPIEDNTRCPGSGRQSEVDCAVFALGNLVGTTLSHEIAHSLGLADPEGPAFHNTGDWVDALMDGGSSRTFAERAEVDGQGPGTFCRAEYAYLQEILPSSSPDPLSDRQDCY